jgi:hypothetical protein
MRPKPVASGTLNRSLLCLAASMSVAGLCLLSADIPAAAEGGPPIVQTPLGPAREAPIGHRQPRLEDLPPAVQRDERLDSPSARTPARKGTEHYLWPGDQNLSICRGC